MPGEAYGMGISGREGMSIRLVHEMEYACGHSGWHTWSSLRIMPSCSILLTISSPSCYISLPTHPSLPLPMLPTPSISPSFSLLLPHHLWHAQYATPLFFITLSSTSLFLYLLFLPSIIPLSPFPSTLTLSLPQATHPSLSTPPPACQ